MSARLVFATSNAHKVSELEAILAPAWEGFKDGCVARMSDFDVASPIEDGVTFEENSLIKARALARATGLAAIADDSGIAVDVLGGAPGIFSARWAGSHGDDEANLHLLLDQLSDVPDRHRGAAFLSAAARAAAIARPVACSVADTDLLQDGQSDIMRQRRLYRARPRQTS